MSSFAVTETIVSEKDLHGIKKHIRIYNVFRLPSAGSAGKKTIETNINNLKIMLYLGYLVV